MSEASGASDALTQGAATVRRERRVLILVLSLTLPLFLLILPSTSPFIRTFSIPSVSNAPTLPRGSYVLVSRASYGYSRYSFDLFDLPIAGRWPALMPSRGDMVVFRLPRNHSIHYVKRVVGLPGDRIQMVDGRLFINGQLVRREPLPSLPDPGEGTRLVDTYLERLPEGASYRIIESQGDKGHFDNTPEFLVPAGHLFVLGDNRDNSIDSREQSRGMGIGFVPVELVIGRVVATF
jgi:signal peptidase I